MEYVISSNPIHFPSYSVKVSPLVCLSILDHYMRRPMGEVRVVGALIGLKSDEGNLLTVTDSFAIPLSENEETIDIDLEHFKKMEELYSKIDSYSFVVGWYATGKITEDTIESLHENFKKENLVLVVDPTNPKIEFKAYTCGPIAFDSEGGIFNEIECAIKYFNKAERQCFDIIKKGVAGPVKLTNGSEMLLDNIEKLISYVDDVKAYCQGVVEGKMESSPEIGKKLMKLMASLKTSDSVEADFKVEVEVN